MALFFETSQFKFDAFRSLKKKVDALATADDAEIVFVLVHLQHIHINGAPTRAGVEQQHSFIYRGKQPLVSA